MKTSSNGLIIIESTLTPGTIDITTKLISSNFNFAIAPEEIGLLIILKHLSIWIEYTVAILQKIDPVFKILSIV